MLKERDDNEGALVSGHDRRLAEANADAATKLAAATEALRGSEQARDARIAALEQERDTASADLALTRDALAAEKRRVEGAQTKWNDDRASLDRAKDALAAALASIEEAESRPLT